MKSKMFEIRDRGTKIGVIAIKTEGDNSAEQAFFDADGFGKDDVVLIRCYDQLAYYDRFAWGNYRTMGEAHRYIADHFDELPNFSVVDVRVILGEERAPAKSEIWSFTDENKA